FEQALIELDGKNGRYFPSLLVGDECSGGHTRQIYGLMSIGLTGLGIANIGVDQIEEGLLLIIFEMFQVAETLQGLFIKALVEAFADQVIERDFQGVGDLFGGIDGRGGFAAFVL